MSWVSPVSNVPTPYAIICKGDLDVGHTGCGQVFLSEKEYRQQMSVGHKSWRCPKCRFGEAYWDDTNYELTAEERLKRFEANH